MLHVQSWKGTFCTEFCCDLPKGQSSMSTGFLMHGWWPNFEVGYPACCQNSYNPSDISSLVESDATMKQNIQYYWPSLAKCKFFDYEFAKHGTCISNYYSGAEGVKRYFNAAISLMKK